MSNLEYRSITEDEIPAFRTAYFEGFGDDANPDDTDANERLRSIQPLDRTVVALDDGDMVGTLGDFPLLVTMPGGAQVPMAGTTEVTVRPTHRRRGILREMMRRHMQMAVDRGEPLAGLWASESAIYGRFGFGLAAEMHRIAFDNRTVQMPTPPADVRLTQLAPERLFDVVAPFWTAQAQTNRPGFIDRAEPRWRMLEADPEEHRDDATKARNVIARRGDEVVGYVAYRQVSKWNHVPESIIKIQAMVAADPDAHRALWHFVANIDLHPHVEFWDAPVDDPIVIQSTNPRALKRYVEDSLYVRVLDVERALTARTYEVDDELQLAIDDDAGYATGTWRLRIVDGSAEVARIADEPAAQQADVVMNVRELGALLLGRDASQQLTEAGLLRGEPTAIQRLGRVLRSSRAPWCPEMF